MTKDRYKFEIWRCIYMFNFDLNKNNERLNKYIGEFKDTHINCKKM